MSPSSLQAGMSFRAITPPIGVELYRYEPFVPRRSKAVRKPLLAQALVLELGKTRVALLACDLYSVSARLTEETRHLVNEMTGIPPENVLLCATHSHSAPEIASRVGGAPEDEFYSQLLIRSFASTVVQAIHELQGVKVYTGQATLSGLGVNRYQPDGYVDTAVQTLELIGNRDEYVLFSFGCPPVSAPQDDLEIDPDFPNRARSILESEYDDAMFLQGSCGDIYPSFSHNRETARCGQMLAGTALVSVGLAQAVEATFPLRSAEVTLHLPVILPDGDDLRERRDFHLARVGTREEGGLKDNLHRFHAEAYSAASERLSRGVALTQACPVQVLQLGDAVILAHPFTLFAEIGIEIRRRSPFRQTMIVSCANGFLGDLPTLKYREFYAPVADDRAYSLGLTPLSPEAAGVFVEEVLKLLEELRHD